MAGAGPGTWKIIYDGGCRFCTAGAARLARSFPAGRAELVDYNTPGALERFPTVTREACEQAMHLVDPAGRVYRGAEAAARAIAARGTFSRWALGYYVPGIRWLSDRLYALVARNRYRIAGRTDPCGACQNGACRLPGGERE
jgi:predicted DCC family thiol-disulfide oxidoreductase YuxK